ncbi:MAG: SAM-dependent methyltransferase, partial [Pseudomonadota bacterium]|nr:SAM-dependent methyltransferase [Pseudomonadota bacterium]
AGQYFTPRPLIEAIVECVRPRPGEIIMDPACGTGGFLLAAHDYIARHYDMDEDEKKHLRYFALRGVELVDGVARLCAMNLFLHEIGDPSGIHKPNITVDDALRDEPTYPVDLVLTNPPFGKKSSITIVDEDESDEDDAAGTREKKQAIVYNRADFWTTTANKQLNFLQHVKSLLRLNGRAAVVLPDNVLFEGGAGEKVREKLLRSFNVHTLLRLPTGIFYAQGVKANVLFFDACAPGDLPQTQTLWVYDLRTNKHFTLKQRPLSRADLDEFVACYLADDRRKAPSLWSGDNPQGRWRPYSYQELMARDKKSLDLFWLRDESLEDSDALPDPDVLAEEIADDLRAALAEIEDVLGDLRSRGAAQEISAASRTAFDGAP